MRVINSCFVLNKHLDTKIKLIWEKNRGLNCDFHDIFKPIENVEIIDKHKKFDFFTAPKPNMLIFYRKYLKKLMCKYYSINNTFLEENSVLKKRFDDNYWKKLKGNVIIDTCYDFFSQIDEFNYYNNFKPITEIQKKINELSNQFNKNIIGVHIRRTDNKQAIEKSRDELFLKKLQNIIDKNSQVQFYLSTDDLSTERLFKSNFGDHIISLENKILNRNSIQGMQDAVVDLYSLANTNYIIGSWWSSFSIIAANLGKIKIEIIQ